MRRKKDKIEEYIEDLQNSIRNLPDTSETDQYLASKSGDEHNSGDTGSDGGEQGDGVSDNNGGGGDPSGEAEPKVLNTVRSFEITVPMFSDGTFDGAFDSKRCPSDRLPIIPSRNEVLFPGITLPMRVKRTRSRNAIDTAIKNNSYIGIVLQTRLSVETPSDTFDLCEIGCVGEIIKEIQMPDNTVSVLVTGKRLFRVKSVESSDFAVFASVRVYNETVPKKGDNLLRLKAAVNNIKDDLSEIIDLGGEASHEAFFALSSFDDPHYAINYACSCALPKPRERQLMLEESNVLYRALMLAAKISNDLQYEKIRSEVRTSTQSRIDKMNREAYLRNEIETIQHQLGDGSADDISRLQKASVSKAMSKEIREIFNKELKKLSRMNEQAPDYSIQLNYLQTIVDLPWGKVSEDNLDLKNAQKILDRDHYGLEKVKDRILEHLAVLKMRGDMKSPILCLVGPPGVGKTSLGKSVAEALNRKYVRVSLGGLHDEAEIRGHRRTYIGSLPGRIISGLLKAGTDNPVFVLDEIDKISSDFHGDPSAAMLEVLDSAQNSAFHDNFLDFDYNLSNVLFIATANDLATIAPPLLDRMEIISLSGYIEDEKVEIAARHLLPRQKEENGLKKVRFSIPRTTLHSIVQHYTRESGVRMLDKRLAKIMRRIAWKSANGEPVPQTLKPADLKEYLGTPDYDPDKYEGNDKAGVVTGLAWTSVGGEILYVESALCKGKSEKLTLTGNLGDVMKESALLALQYVRSHADELKIPEAVFDNYNVHIHCPEGAIPKDGPSAGIAMVTSLASTFTQRKVRARLAMTGEITLRGRVIPIGGVKEKILAARRAGITDVILCEDNRKDIGEIKAQYIEGLTFHYVRDVRDVLNVALLDEKVAHPLVFDLSEHKGADAKKEEK